MEDHESRQLILETIETLLEIQLGSIRQVLGRGRTVPGNRFDTGDVNVSH